jgi:hypothetical protein
MRIVDYFDAFNFYNYFIFDHEVCPKTMFELFPLILYRNFNLPFYA